MNVVIQCASKKDPAAGSLYAADGRPVMFVADPGRAPSDSAVCYARPDDASDDGRSWRRRLAEYNEAGDNPFGLLPAYRLYEHCAYTALAERFGRRNLFILSAGWGLIQASFLTPHYDITFSASADDWKRRRKDDCYEDFCMLPDVGEPVVFVGGKDYQPLFSKLTSHLRASKIVFFNSARIPVMSEGFEAVRYSTRTRTNWHYECAQDLAAGIRLVPDGAR